MVNQTLGESMLEKLQEQIDRQQDKQVIAGTPWLDLDLVFRSNVRMPIKYYDTPLCFKITQRVSCYGDPRRASMMSVTNCGLSTRRNSRTRKFNDYELGFIYYRILVLYLLLHF